MQGDPIAQQLADRLFPDLPFMEARLRPDPAVQDVVRARALRIRNTFGCKDSPACIVDSFRLTDAERDIFAHALPGNKAASFQRYATAIDRILLVYGDGASPRYPVIDSLDRDITGSPISHATFSREIDMLARLDAPASVDTSPLGALISFATDLLVLAGRDDAVRNDALATQENAATLRVVRKTNWRRYPYTVIIVPGVGPLQPGVPLDPAARIRLRLAVAAFDRGDAPFILLSGGAVHPAHTRFVEAHEMRRALIETFHIAPDRILVETVARHTTTNLRNAARVLAGIGAPEGRPALVTTDRQQATYMRGEVFARRCRDEMGALPGRILLGPNGTDTVFIPDGHIPDRDPSDPLDP